MNLISELKRRNVFRAAIAYGIVAWGIAQIADLMADNFDAPDALMRLLLIVLLIGFPVTMVISWLYILTPSGLLQQSESPNTHAQPITLNNRYDRFIIIALVAVIGYFVWDKFGLNRESDQAFSETPISQPETQGESSKQINIAEHKSIAVLPFVNMSEDINNEYFADGLAEELLNMLVKIPGLQVAARTSSFSFKGRNVNISEIGRELNVSHILEGSVRKSGDEVRITAQLIQADNGFHLWSATFDRTLRDIFKIQDEIASEVAKKLKVNLLGNSRSETTINPEAYALYLKGLYFFQQRGHENIAKAKEPILQALELEPDYAVAWTDLALIYNEEVYFGLIPHDEGIRLAKNAIQQAKIINPDYGRAWGVEGLIKKNSDWDWHGAQQDIKKAHELDPTDELNLISRASMAGTLGNIAESLLLYQQAFRTDPLNLSTHTALGLAYLKLGRYPEAIKIFSRQTDLQENSRWAHFNLARTYLLMGNHEQALIEIAKNPENSFKKSGLALIYSSQGKESEAQGAIQDLLEGYTINEHSLIASVYAWTGDKEQAFTWLQKAVNERETGIAYLLGDPMFFSLREDPRWAQLLDEVGLLEYWQAMPTEIGGPL